MKAILNVLLFTVFAAQPISAVASIEPTLAPFVDGSSQHDIARLQAEAEEGSLHAQISLALHLLGGGKEETDSLAAKWLRSAAETGDAEALYRLGMLYAEGRGVARDEYEATALFRRAAGMGHIKAMHNAGVRSDLGKGCPQDKREAARWYRAAGDVGFADSQFNYAVMLANGDGVRRDMREAVRWYTFAAEGDHNQAQHNLGVLYRNGFGVPRDEVLALSWFNIAAASGLEAAIQARNALEAKLDSAAVLRAQEISRETYRQILLSVQPALSSGSVFSGEPTAGSPRATGSGFVVSSSGLVVTAAHVIADASVVKVSIGGTEVLAAIERVDAANDIAILNIGETRLSPIPIAPSHTVRLGQRVATIGFPLIETLGRNPKVGQGDITSTDGHEDDPRAWQISVPIHLGNSGGPLLDEFGRAIGVVVSKISSPINNDLPQSIAYARKSAYLLAALEPYRERLQVEGAASGPSLSLAEIAERAVGAVVQVHAY